LASSSRPIVEIFVGVRIVREIEKLQRILQPIENSSPWKPVHFLEDRTKRITSIDHRLKAALDVFPVDGPAKESDDADIVEGCVRIQLLSSPHEELVLGQIRSTAKRL
jgi:hypothetical protein